MSIYSSKETTHGTIGLYRHFPVVSLEFTCSFTQLSRKFHSYFSMANEWLRDKTIRREMCGDKTKGFPDCLVSIRQLSSCYLLIPSRESAYLHYSLKQWLPTLLWISINSGVQQIVVVVGLYVIPIALQFLGMVLGHHGLSKIMQCIKSKKS